MRRILFTLALSLTTTTALAAPAMSYSGQPSPPTAGEEREIAGLFDRWNAALATGNAERVADLYARDGVLLPTVSNQVRASRAEIENYFSHFLAAKPRGVINYRQVRLLDDDSAVDAGVYTFTLTNPDGSTRKVQARYTFVYEKRDGQWLIINHHSSAMPEAGGGSKTAAH
ncbi:SgcJ/EcaC family oxidoreductase [Xanthomonas sp. NCPPB 2654]|uniref:SgcJ/EcaC family oxidoreductase n=1 Tax=unclassified Xanthomonas TaxID=2643310 RepID=UPI0021E0DBC5|nr:MULTISPECIES: SgcJ/EcaC family oxidoreductase [unclassified Xanthomonas]MDL5367447.1 SgcJ/EcaC family oxidoreductase [Xanthomonas sp. NCPPB 2654]UYC21686.1 SgcJ/EcaC family oxidoreductase [Xanthomonas sp. CFBP 8443]